MPKAPVIVAGAAGANDSYSIGEDQAAAGTVKLAILINDPAKASLYSLDDGQSADLLTQDAVLAPQTSRLGATIAITADGQVSYRFDSPVVQALAPGQTLQDSFLYAVRMQNGNLVWQTATVTITGSNDAPVAVADVAAVAEDTLATGTVATNDRDADNGAVLTFATTDQIPPGFSMASNGAWAFDGSNPAYQSLAAGQSQDYVVVYWVTDQYGASSNASLTLTVTGRNDAPALAAATAVADEDVLAIGRLSGTDPDGDALTYTVVGEAPAGFAMGADGIWTLDGAAYQSLGARDFPTLTVNVAATDSAGASAASTLTIILRGANDAPVAGAVSGQAAEDATVVGILPAGDPDSDDHLIFELVGVVPAGLDLGMAPDGSWMWRFDGFAAGVQSLDYGFHTLSATYRVTDLWGESATATITLSVRGNNDAPTAAAAIGAVNEDGAVSGQLPVGDVDSGARLTVTAIGSQPGLTINSDGSWTYDANQAFLQSLAQGQTQQLATGYRVTDEWGASATSTLTVTVTGANDGPVTTSQWFEVTENLPGIGSLMAWDQDNGARLTYAFDGQAPAGLTLINGALYFDGSNAAYDHLTYGEVQLVQVPFTVTDEFGATASSFLMLSVTGRNDAATIGGVLTGSVTEAANGNAGIPGTEGQLTLRDPDSPESWQPVAADTASLGGYGRYALTADGAWSYQLDNGNPAVAALNAGQSLQDYFTVHSADGSSSVVTITIRGATDSASPPVSTAPDPNDFDLLADSSAAAGPVNYVGTASSNGAHGSQLGDMMIGMEGSDTLYAHGGNDQLWGDFWDPAIAGANFYIDRLYGQAGNDTLYGGAGGDYLYGGSGNDTLYANGSNGFDGERNYLYGGSGDDRIYGSVGGDEIRGGTGADVITGGAGADRFFYSAFNETGDTITDFTNNLDAFDFTSLGMNYRFVGQVSAPQMLQPGQIGYVAADGNVILYVDGYATEQGPDMAITLLGISTLSATAVWFG